MMAWLRVRPDEAQRLVGAGPIPPAARGCTWSPCRHLLYDKSEIVGSRPALHPGPWLGGAWPGPHRVPAPPLDWSVDRAGPSFGPVLPDGLGRGRRCPRPGL
jgi:hypothetical protein